MMRAAIPRGLAQGVRSGGLFAKRGSTVLDAPEESYASGLGGAVGSGPAPSARRDGVGTVRRAYAEARGLEGPRDADGFGDDGEYRGGMRRPGLRVSFRTGVVPSTIWGRVAAGGGLLLVLGGMTVGVLGVRSFLLRDEHFLVPSSSAIQIAGNSHLTRPQLLSVFGEDVERNIFKIPLAERRAELERLPWVAHATVMRLLPNRVRVAIVERTPVAFVRQGSRIDLVDANGVLLDMAARGRSEDGAEAEGWAEADETPKPASYSFPVLTGISAGDPLSTRAARVRIFLQFVAALDATGEGISRRVSEVDVSNPEDLKATLADDSASGAGPEIVVHFGGEKFLERYRRYEEHLGEWRAQYPKLASVDMRYERQVVLEMQPGASSGGAEGAGGVGAPKSKVAAATKQGDQKPMVHPVEKPKSGTPGTAVKKAAAITPASGPDSAGVQSSAGGQEPARVVHLTTAYAVGAPAGGSKQVGGAKVVGRSAGAGLTGTGSAGAGLTGSSKGSTVAHPMVGGPQ